MVPWSRSAGAIFLDWLAPTAGQMWADIGCGNGAFSALVTERAAPAHICGIDPSDAQVSFARQQLANKPVELTVGDAMALPYENARFDFSVMALVLFFVPDPQRAVSEMARVTKPGGTVASYTWDAMRGGMPNQHVLEELEALGRSVARPPSAKVSRFEDLKTLWSGIGAAEIETREVVVQRSFLDFEDYWNCMVLSSPSGIAGKLSNAEAIELKKRLQARLPTAANGEITIHASASAIKGRIST